MGSQYPPLDREQVEAILTNLDFSPKRHKKTSHSQWEGYTGGKRRVVTVDHLKRKKRNMDINSWVR